MEIKNVHCEKQALELFRMMPDNKKSALHNALSRNLEFTTSWGLELGELRAYENGVYITLQGTRCSFSVYAEWCCTRQPSGLPVRPFCISVA